MSTGNGQNFGSNMGSMPGRQQQNWTPSYGGSQAYQGAYNNMAQGLQQMPQFGPRMGPFGRGRPGAVMPPMGGMGGPGTPGQPGWNPNMGGPMSGPGGRDYVEMGPDSQMPGYRPPGAPPLPSPPTYAGPEQTGGMDPMGQLNQPMDKPMQMPQDSGLHPMQQPQALPMQNQTNAMLQNTANVAGFQNPYGFSQQQLGPSFNPMGSPQGGYFNGNNYVANVGNARNGLDRMSRMGLNWNGLPFGKIGA